MISTHIGSPLSTSSPTSQQTRQASIIDPTNLFKIANNMPETVKAAHISLCIQASRLRREASDAQIADYATLTRDLPKLLVTGMHDRMVPPVAMAAFEASLGCSSRSVVLPGCGHLSHEEAAPQLQAHLVEFIQGCLWL